MRNKILFMTLLIAGCSIQQDRVGSIPPNLNNEQKLSQEYGKINLTATSVFLWPDMPTSAAAVSLYESVAKDAAASDQIELRDRQVQAQIAALSSNGFDYAPCFTNFEAACSATPPAGSSSCDDVQLNNDTVQTWVYQSVDQVPTDDLKKLFASCRSFTDSKISLAATHAALSQKDLELTEKILYQIDPDYEKTRIQTNYKTVANKSVGSSIAITHGAGGEVVDIRIDGFLDEKNYQSNTQGVTSCQNARTIVADKGTDPNQIYDVTYSHTDRTLTFKVPEVIDCAPTGGVYAFTLERTDFGGNPRFSGDLIYTKAGVSKNGSAKFDGTF